MLPLIKKWLPTLQYVIDILIQVKLRYYIVLQALDLQYLTLGVRPTHLWPHVIVLMLLLGLNTYY